LRPQGFDRPVTESFVFQRDNSEKTAEKRKPDPVRSVCGSAIYIKEASASGMAKKEKSPYAGRRVPTHIRALFVYAGEVYAEKDSSDAVFIDMIRSDFLALRIFTVRKMLW